MGADGVLPASVYYLAAVHALGIANLGAPDQAVLVDLPNSRFYFFFIELWPQEVSLLHGVS